LILYDTIAHNNNTQRRGISVNEDLIEFDTHINFEERNYRLDGQYTGVGVHYHKQTEIFYLLEGSGTCFINTEVFHLEKGCVLVIPANMPHSSLYSNPKNSRMVLNCDMRLFSYDIAMEMKTPFYIPPKPELESEISFLFHKIKKEYASEEKYANAVLTNYVSLLIILLLRAKINVSSETVKTNFIEKAISYIHKQYPERIRLTDAAQYCGVRPEHLSRTFKQKTQLNFNEYVLSYRLRQAEIQLLDPSSKSISKIAYDCGFNDGNYFSSCFRKKYGMTPSQFREQEGEKEKL